MFKYVANMSFFAAVAVIVVVVAAIFLLVRLQQGQEDKQHCQQVISNMKHRGPLDELTSEDAKCMELLN